MLCRAASEERFCDTRNSPSRTRPVNRRLDDYYARRQIISARPADALGFDAGDALDLTFGLKV